MGNTFTLDETSELDDFFSGLTNTHKSTSDDREKLITKAMKMVDGIDEDSINGMSSKDIEARLGILREAGSLITAKEQSIERLTKLQLQKKRDEDETDAGAIIVELLKKLPVVGDKGISDIDIQAMDRAIDEEHRNSGMEITEGELRTDSQDLG